MSVVHECLVLNFPGQGHGGRELIMKILNPTLPITQLDSQLLYMLASTKMMLSERVTSTNGNMVLPEQTSNRVVLKMNATKEFRDMVVKFITGQRHMDTTVWNFLILGGYVQIYNEHEDSARGRAVPPVVEAPPPVPPHQPRQEAPPVAAAPAAPPVNNPTNQRPRESGSPSEEVDDENRNNRVQQVLVEVEEEEDSPRYSPASPSDPPLSPQFSPRYSPASPCYCSSDPEPEPDEPRVCVCRHRRRDDPPEAQFNNFIYPPLVPPPNEAPRRHRVIPHPYHPRQRNQQRP